MRNVIAMFRPAGEVDTDPSEFWQHTWQRPRTAVGAGVGADEDAGSGSGSEPEPETEAYAVDVRPARSPSSRSKL